MHEVETMFSARLTPWHELGVITDRELTATEALTTAGLDWQVDKMPVYALTELGFSEIADKRAVVRNTDSSVLGVVGTDYEPIQNHTMFRWVETLLDTDEALFTTAGSLRGGRIVFACLELKQKIQIPGDTVFPYFVIASSHDGSSSFRGFKTNVRVVCKNTLDMAESRKSTQWTIRHTQLADFRLDSARRMLGLVIAQNDEFSQMAHRMIEQTVTDATFEYVRDKVLPMPKEPTDRIRDNVVLERSKVNRIYGGQTIGQFRGTVWGALNAFNEYELWSKNVKGNRAERHALRSLQNDFPVTEKARGILERIAV